MPDHVARNRTAWEQAAPSYAGPGRENWSAPEPYWGIWQVPEAEVGALPDVAGLDVVELGCGTAYFSAWLAHRGARPVGIDISPAQLATARELQAEHGLEFPLIEASAEEVPLGDDCADLVLSEYGASLWCEPEAWIAEAARLLRPGGTLVFCTNSLLAALCTPDQGASGPELLRAQRGLRTLEWPGEEGVEFHLAHGEWIALLRRHRFTVEALHELYAPAGAEDPIRWEWVTPEWAAKWPYEEIWAARRG